MKFFRDPLLLGHFLLSTSIYDLVLIHVCHFHHHHLIVSQILPLSRYSCCYLGSLHPRNFCQKKFSLQPNLEEHFTKVHINIRDFACDICKKTFHSNYRLERHKASFHDGDKNYECEICKMTFVKEYIEEHMKRVHAKMYYWWM